MRSWKFHFFMIWTGQALSLLGSSLVDFALIWWLTAESGSEQVLIISTLLTLLPRMILGPFAGSLIDRTNRKHVMVVADAAIAVVTLGLLVMYCFERTSIALVLGVLLLRSLGSMFHQPAMKSATALLVPPDQLARIGGFNRVLSGCMSILSPVFGALLIEVFDLSAILLIDLLTALLAITTLAFARIPDVLQNHAAKNSVLSETVQGLNYVFTTRSLLFVVGSCTLANLCLGPCHALRSLLVTKVFGGGVTELSWITAAGGAGLLIGGVIMGVWGGFRRNLITSGFGWLGVGACFAAISFLPGNGIMWLVACMFVGQVFSAIGCAGLDAFYETNVPKEFHGRVFAVLNTLDNATVPIGLVAAALLGDKIPIQTWFLITGILHMLLFVFWSGSRELKRAEE